MLRQNLKNGIIVAGIIIVVTACLCACGDKDKAANESDTCEIALITDDIGVNGGAFQQMVWEAIDSYCEENGMTRQYYASENNEDAYMASIRKARRQGAKLLVLAGEQFETVAYKAQSKYEDLYFVLLDGVPRDEEYNYKTAANSTGVLFAEQEAGYLAGYAAVCEGYRNIGFMGGEALPPVKRYGYGFVQGVNAAVRERNAGPVSIKYAYMGTFEASDEIESESYSWYSDGTEVIFACGGSIGESVMAGAESADSKVIGVDVDQSFLSDTVITSAEKEAGRAIIDILKTYKRNNFGGGAILTYSAENNGIGLEMTNSRMKVFNKAAYDTVYSEIKDGSRTIIDSIENTDVNALVDKPVTITVVEE